MTGLAPDNRRLEELVSWLKTAPQDPCHRVPVTVERGQQGTCSKGKGHGHSEERPRTGEPKETRMLQLWGYDSQETEPSWRGFRC